MNDILTAVITYNYDISMTRQENRDLMTQLQTIQLKEQQRVNALTRELDREKAKSKSLMLKLRDLQQEKSSTGTLLNFIVVDTQQSLGPYF